MVRVVARICHCTLVILNQTFAKQNCQGSTMQPGGAGKGSC